MQAPYKAWVFLMTCLPTLGICLEIFPSYNSAVCIRGLSRRFSRRGTPVGEVLNGILFLMSRLGGEEYTGE